MPTPIWSGAVTFGLVSIPVRMLPATERKDVRFNQVHRKDGHRVVQRYFCEEDGNPVEAHEIVRGYPVGSGRYVRVTDDELAKVPVSSTHAIDIQQFVDLSTIDPIYFQGSYYLEPEELGMKPFALLLACLRQSGLAAIGKFTLRLKEHVCVLRAYDETIVLSPLLYADEVRTTKGLKAPEPDSVAPELLDAATHVVELMTKPFDHGTYQDGYREALLAVIESKKPAVPAADADQVSPAPVLPDLMAALQDAVRQVKANQATQKRRRSSVSV